MYETFFGLTENPFGMTPDPDCIFQSDSHREAFASLSYGISARRGFMTLVGEVGTGKTTLINAVLDSLDRSTVSILVRHTTIDREELLRIILQNLVSLRGQGKASGRRKTVSDSIAESRVASLSRIELINEFHGFVEGKFTACQPPPLLIIDEAQNLSVDVLEEVRLLTNLEDRKSKMLQVFLAGQPELEEKLMRPDLRQLRQRIAVRARLEPLSLSDTAAYIAFRLKKAGCTNENLFAREAVQAVWSASKGSPRTINILCDYALVNAFALGMHEVSQVAVREAIQDVFCVQLGDTNVQRPRPYLVSHSEPAGDADADEAAAPGRNERELG
jgi:general secretion pathway protein A